MERDGKLDRWDREQLHREYLEGIWEAPEKQNMNCSLKHGMSAHGAKHKMMSVVGFHGIMIISHSHEYVQSDESLQHDKSKSIYVQLDDIFNPKRYHMLMSHIHPHFPDRCPGSFSG